MTIDVIANDGAPFDGVLTLYAGKSSTVVATGTSLGSGETFLQFDGGGTYSSYTLELQDNGNDQTGGYTIFVNVPNSSGSPGVARYTPTTGNDTVTGNLGRDLLVGGGGNDTLIGREGHDVLIGGPGADTLQGGVAPGDPRYTPDDNDVYVYVDATDTVIEQPGSGTDTIWTREVSFTLPANVENLLLVEGTAARDGIGNELDNVITGNSAHNGLVGGDGNDTLIGGGGADDMFGGLGNDTYSVDNASDLVGEPFGGGFDTVRSSLPAYVLADTLEALILDPGATWAIGNAGDNTLIGNAISNYLIGYGGNDSLSGIGSDTSNDTMIGGLGDDTYQLGQRRRRGDRERRRGLRSHHLGGAFLHPAEQYRGDVPRRRGRVGLRQRERQHACGRHPRKLPVRARRQRLPERRRRRRLPRRRGGRRRVPVRPRGGERRSGCGFHARPGPARLHRLRARRHLHANRRHSTGS